MSEHVKWEGKRSVKTKEINASRLRISGMVDALRDKLDPTAPIEELPAKQIAEMAFDFSERHEEYLGQLAELKVIKRQMGC